VSLPRADPPVFLIVAGPNGSRKSSVYRDADLEWGGRSMWIVNPDSLAARSSEIESSPLREANLAAVERIEIWLDASIAVHKTVGVETVRSTAKYRRLVAVAKSLGFLVWIIYVVLDSPERSIERIKLRVAKGGHSVADDDVRKGYMRSLQQFPWFLEQSDRAWIYDNSGATPQLVGEKFDGVVSVSEDALPALLEAIRSIDTD
jgi:predicted ABC-type ATPase